LVHFPLPMNIFSEIRRRTSKPINVNFLCHNSPTRNSACEDTWVQCLTPYYQAAAAWQKPIPAIEKVTTSALKAVSHDLLDLRAVGNAHVE
jgi:nitronate monooxygenase